MHILDHTQVAFIGAGNMAHSLIQGLVKQGLAPSQICIADPMPEQRAKFDALGIQTFADNNQAIAEADAIVLAVKPQIAQQVVTALSALQPTQLLISIAAGINLTSLQNWTHADQTIIRSMPNTPALVGAGISGLFANAGCQPEHKNIAEQILSAVGEAVWVADEPAIDSVTAVSGSGPAYFFLMMEAMISAGVAMGLDPETAKQLTIQTAKGAALMAEQASEPPAQLRENVTSPGGTTAAAIEVMTQAGMNAIIEQALSAAETRAGELAEEFGG